MSRSFSVTSGAKRQRCMKRGCDRWEFKKGLCAPCSKEGGLLVQLADQDWEVYRNKAPIAVKLVVVTIKDEPYFLELGEGDYVNVLEWQPKGLADVAIVRTVDEVIGYYSIASLKTEEQIYDEFTINEDYDLLLELEGQEEAEREREAQFEQNLKSRMKLKAEEDRKNREGENKRRREEAERMLREYEEQKAFAEKDSRAAAAAKKTQDKQQAELQNKQAARLRQDASAIREADERAFQARINSKEAASAAWEASEAERKDKEYLDSLPAWKRGVILRKREEAK